MHLIITVFQRGTVISLFLLIHGGKDTQVNPVSTENMYTAMIQAGTSPDICKKVIVPSVDHGDGAVPCMIQGILFLNNLNSSR